MGTRASRSGRWSVGAEEGRGDWESAHEFGHKEARHQISWWRALGFA